MTDRQANEQPRCGDPRCAHPQGWHRAGEGSCIECACLQFMPDRQASIERAREEFEALGLLSYHGMHGAWYADLLDYDIDRIRDIIRELASALADAEWQRDDAQGRYGNERFQREAAEAALADTQKALEAALRAAEEGRNE